MTKSKAGLAVLAASSLGLMVAGCSASSTASSAADAGAAAAEAAAPIVLPSTFAVTADWLGHTLSVVDVAALVKGATTRQSVLLGQVDLSSYAQGPYTVKITPDGKTALVTLSAGFFSIAGAATLLVNAPSVPTGPSKLLFVDLASRKVEAALDTGDGATGIAITHDGARAFVCHVGTNNLTVVDVKARTILQQVDLGGPYAEEVAFDDTDTVGAITIVPAGGTTSKSVRTFAVTDMAATLSPPIDLGNDAAGVPFFPGTKMVYVVLAYTPLLSPASGYALIDATDPAAPVKVTQVAWSDSTYIDYQAIPAPSRSSILVPVVATGSGRLSVREYGLGQGDVVLKNTFDVAAASTFGAFGLVLDAAGHVVMTLPRTRQLAVLDLGTQSVFTVPWGTAAGPMGIALH